MIKVFVMQTCPDCEWVKKELTGDDRFEIIDIGAHVRNLKRFLTLRDTNPAFAEVKKRGSIGIPCFVTEEGRVTFDSRELGILHSEQEFAPESVEIGAACGLDGKGC